MEIKSKNSRKNLLLITYYSLLQTEVLESPPKISFTRTEDGIAYELLELGVPKDDIVLGFQPLKVRHYTEFAIS